MDFAQLVVEAETRSLRSGADDLDDFADTAERTERRTQDSTDGMTGAFRGFGRNAALALTGVVGAIVSYQTAADSFSRAATFDAALAETSTLIEGTEDQLMKLSDAAKTLADDFGTNATQQMNAFYQAISAGSETIDEANALLVDANKLAEGGITSVETAVRILSGSVNSYGKDVLTTAQVSDALFVGMRAGVTTVDELANSIGKVVPVGKALGLTFDEVVAATSALTKNNLTTSESVTALNAALTAVAGPSKQAADLAAAIGLEFNSAALQSKGFAAFMQDVADKTGGNVDAMRTLFGSVEGMKAGLLFAGEAGGQFNEIMADMENKVGQTDIAVQKINASLSDRLDDSLARLGLLALDFGEVLLTAAVPALEMFVSGAQLAADNLDLLAVAVIGFAATQIPAAVASIGTMTAAFIASGGAAGVLTGAVTVLRGALIALGGPLGLLYGLAGSTAAAMILLSDDTGTAETAMYDAAKGTNELNAALGGFYQTGAPSAGAAAIALANDNYALADSAYAVAAAELAKSRALLNVRNTAGAGGSAGSIKDTGITVTQRDVDADIAALDAATAALDEARAGRDRAVRAVTGADYSAVSGGSPINLPAINTPDINVAEILAGAGGGSGSGSGGGGGRIKDVTDSARVLQDLMREGASITESLRTEQQKYNDAMDQADRLLKVGALSTEAYQQHTRNLAQELAEAEWGSVVDGISQITDGLIDAAIAGDNLMESFLNMIAQMALAAAKSGLNDIIGNMFGQAPAQGNASGILGMFGGGGAGGGLGGLISGFFGGFRADGGSTRADKGYIVGEDGPEWFMPGVAGHVTSTDEIKALMTGMRQPSPNVNVASPDVVVFDDPRKIDEYRMSPMGERRRRDADRRLQDA